jgi:hypothetical protein
MDKENEVPTDFNRDLLVSTPPLPKLVPMASTEGGRKSSVKKVRFSLDTDVPPERESPVRLNRDIIPEGEEIPNPSRMSVAGRRSSIGLSDSPMHFPSEADLLGGPTPGVPVGSPSDSRQSTGSSITEVLSSALNSFGVPGGGQPAQRPRSIWDTPSSSAKKTSASGGSSKVSAVPLNLHSSPGVQRKPSRASIASVGAGTPGNAEQKMFGFHVVLEGKNDVDISVQQEERESPAIVVPSPAAAAEDDPMLLSGASSRVHRIAPSTGGTSQKRTRRRRLSHLDDMESELLNVSSPERAFSGQTPSAAAPVPIERAPPIRTVESLLAAIDSPMVVTEEETFQFPSNITDSDLAQIVAQQKASIELTRLETVNWVEDLIAERKLRTKAVLESEEGEKILKARIPENVYEAAIRKAELLGDTVRMRMLENYQANLSQSQTALDRFEETLEFKQQELERITQQTESLEESVASLLAETEKEFEAKFTIDSEGNAVRRKSEEERRMDELEAFIKSHEEAIKEAVMDIAEMEQVIAERETEFTENFSRMRQFYLDNGWNVVCQVGESLVLIYAVCHILVFERAKNNTAFWKLDRIVPARIDPGKPPHYAPYIVSDQVRWNSQQVLEQIVKVNGLDVAFEYEPTILCELMAAAVTTLCEWVELKDALGRCLPSSESRAKINSNLQIEISVIVMNKSLGDSVEVPMLVKLLWFDSLPEKIRFDNFSFIACEALQVYFPFVKADIDERLAAIHPSDVHSPSLLLEIVRAVSSVLVNAKLDTPSYA